MTLPRPPQRRPVRESPPFVAVEPQPALPGAEAPVRTEAPPPTARHIPRFLILPTQGEAGASTAQTTGAHRFPGAPTPVLGAAVGLLGYASMQASSRPWRRGRSYRVARIRAEDPQKADLRALSSARLPKV